MDNSTQHELKLFQLFHNQRNEASFHGTPYASHEHTYIVNPSHYPGWHSGAQVTPSHPGSNMPEWSLGASYHNSMGLDQSSLGTPKCSKL